MGRAVAPAVAPSRWVLLLYLPPVGWRNPAPQAGPGRLGLTPQADDQRTLKRPIYYPAQPGRFSGLRLLARRFTSGRTRIGTTRLGLNTGGVETQVRLGINTQADDQRTLKRPIYYPAQPGRFSGLRPLARRFTPGRTPFGTTRLGLNTGGVETQHFTLASLQTRSVQPNRPDSPRPDRF